MFLWYLDVTSSDSLLAGVASSNSLLAGVASSGSLLAGVASSDSLLADVASSDSLLAGVAIIPYLFIIHNYHNVYPAKTVVTTTHSPCIVKSGQKLILLNTPFDQLHIGSCVNISSIPEPI